MTQQVLARIEGVWFWGALEGATADTQLQIGVVEIDVVKIFTWWVPVMKTMSENQMLQVFIDQLVSRSAWH